MIGEADTGEVIGIAPNAASNQSFSKHQSANRNGNIFAKFGAGNAMDGVNRVIDPVAFRLGHRLVGLAHLSLSLRAAMGRGILEISNVVKPKVGNGRFFSNRADGLVRKLGHADFIR